MKPCPVCEQNQWKTKRRPNGNSVCDNCDFVAITAELTEQDLSDPKGLWEMHWADVRLNNSLRQRVSKLEEKLQHAEFGRTLAHEEADRRLNEWSKSQARVADLERQVSDLKNFREIDLNLNAQCHDKIAELEEELTKAKFKISIEKFIDEHSVLMTKLAIAEQTEPLISEMRYNSVAAQTFLARVKELETALGFYASEDTWSNAECDALNSEGGFFPYGIEECPIAEDEGKVARKALGLESK